MKREGVLLAYAKHHVLGKGLPLLEGQAVTALGAGILRRRIALIDD